MSPNDEPSEKLADSAPELVQSQTANMFVAGSGGPPMAVPSVDQFIGTTIGHYKIVSVIGMGGMSVVFRATHLLLGHDVAVKLLLPDRYLNATAIKRFHQEAKSMIRLQSPHIVPLREFNVHEDGRPYLVADLAEGQTLAEILAEEQSLPIERAVRIGIDICLGLEEAHKHGIIHRDLKPSNVIVTKDPDGQDFCKILDFGIAKSVEQDESSGALTKSGEVIGSPLYMSPEQCQGVPIDQRTDIYSLGCLLYQCITGHLPFPGNNMIEIMMHHLNSPAPDLNSGNAFLDEVVSTCLAKQPAERFANVAEVKKVLLRIAAGESASGRKRIQPAAQKYKLALIALVAMVLVTSVAAAWINQRQQPTPPPVASSIMKQDLTQSQDWLWPEPPMRETPKHVTAEELKHFEDLSERAVREQRLKQSARSQHELAVFSEQIEDWDHAWQAYDHYSAKVEALSKAATPESMRAKADALRCRYKFALRRLIGVKKLRFVDEHLRTIESESKSLITEMKKSSDVSLQPYLRSAYLLHGNALYLLRRFPEAADEFRIALEIPGVEPKKVSSEQIVRARWADCERSKGKNELAASLYEQALSAMLKPAFGAEPPEKPLQSTDEFSSYVNKLHGANRFRASFPSQTQRSNIVYGLVMASMLKSDAGFGPAPEWFFFEMLTKETFNDFQFDDNELIYCEIMDGIATRVEKAGNEDEAQRLRAHVTEVLKTNALDEEQ